MSATVSPLLSRLVALSLLVLVIVLGWTLFIGPIRADFDAQEDRLSRANQLLVRYERALDEEPNLRAEIEELRKSDGSPDPFLTGNSTQIIAAKLQNQIQTLVAGEPSLLRNSSISARRFGCRDILRTRRR